MRKRNYNSKRSALRKISINLSKISPTSLINMMKSHKNYYLRKKQSNSNRRYTKKEKRLLKLMKSFNKKSRSMKSNRNRSNGLAGLLGFRTKRGNNGKWKRLKERDRS